MAKNSPTEEEKIQLKVLQVSMRSVYDSIGSCCCPALNIEDEVYFNAKGWYHLQHDIHGNGRGVKSRIQKLALIPLVVPVLKYATKVDEYREREIPLRRKKGVSKTLVDYWAFVTYVGKKRNIKVKVVVIRPKNAEKTIFWSVMRLGTKKAPDGKLL